METKPCPHCSGQLHLQVNKILTNEWKHENVFKEFSCWFKWEREQLKREGTYGNGFTYY